MLNYNSEEAQSSISKFEQMLKTNLNYFFDAQEFEDIVNTLPRFWREPTC